MILWQAHAIQNSGNEVHFSMTELFMTKYDRLAFHAVVFLVCFFIGTMHAIELMPLIWSALITLSSLGFLIASMCRQENEST